MNEKKLIVKVNFWPPEPNTDGEIPFKGTAVHPVDKSDGPNFNDTTQLITLLKKWNKANVAWDDRSKTSDKAHKGLVFFLILEPHDDNQHELQGLIQNGEDTTLIECFCSDKKLIDIINHWNGEKFEESATCGVRVMVENV